MADLSNDVTFAPGQPSPLPTSQSGAPPFGITVGASPFVYVAPYAMAIIVAGGSVSVLTYSRGGVSAALGLLGGSIELSAGDSLTVTWLVTKPTMTGIPR